MAGFNRFMDISDELKDECQLLVKNVADGLKTNIQGFILMNNQIDTGAMFDSVKVGKGKYTRHVRVGVPYAGFQNYGTWKMPARPFFEPAIEISSVDLNGGLAKIAAKLK